MTAHHHRQASLLAPPFGDRYRRILDRERLQKLERAKVLCGHILGGGHVATSVVDERRIKGTQVPLYRRRGI